MSLLLNLVTDYGRDIIDKIGESPLRLYDQMSRKGTFKQGDYSTLLMILEKADCGDTVEELRRIINTHGLPAYSGVYTLLYVCSEMDEWVYLYVTSVVS